jgi:YfiH family protein
MRCVGARTTEMADLPTACVPELSAVPGLVHGFERRTARTRPETREETRRRVAESLAGLGRLFLLKQVHGATVVEAPFQGAPEADAVVAGHPGLLVGVETADCLPILLADRRHGLVAAVHAGWRGTARGVAARAVAALGERGSDPRELLAALGPGIGACCYEVGDELRAAFGSVDDGTIFRSGPRGRPHLDLRAANRRQLERAGLRPESIHELVECTSCRPDLYPSYRRDGAGAGRMVSFVGFKRVAPP